MKIELSRIEYNLRMSEETNAFAADLIIEGIKAGIASNSGKGGATTYYANNEEGQKLIRQAEEFCIKLPAKEYEHFGKKQTIKMNLEQFIDDLVDKHLNAKELEKFRNKIARMMKDCIVYGLPDRSARALKFKVPISMMLTHPDGEKVLTGAIVKSVLPKLEPGEKILNTNIPEKIFKAAGLSENQYTKYEDSQKQETNKKVTSKKGIKP